MRLGLLQPVRRMGVGDFDGVEERRDFGDRIVSLFREWKGA